MGIKWKAANPEKVRAANAIYRSENRVACNERNAHWRANNLEKARASSRDYARRNIEKQKQWNEANPEIHKKAVTKWVLKNRDLKTYYAAKRRFAKAQALPKWADLEGIRLFYWLAKQMRRVIDHIIPLQHPLVCGLHTVDNLQMLTGIKNLKKGNMFNVV